LKHNLKNFPRLVADPTTNEQEIIKWFENFKKILEDLVFELEDCDIRQSEKLLIELHRNSLQDVFNAGYAKGQYELAREILGEDIE